MHARLLYFGPAHTRGDELTFVPEDGVLLSGRRLFLVDLQSRAQALKRQGKSAGDAGQEIAAEFATRYAGWQALNGVPQAVQLVYADTP